MIVNPFTELPLAIFTTLVPASIGCYITLSLAVLTGAARSDDAKFGRAFLAPTLLMVVAFVGAFFHLHDPLHAFGALTGLGSSPLSNEIFAASLFFIAAIASAIAGWMNKLSGTSSRVLLIAGCILGVALAVFTGLAYNVSTIPNWANPWVVVEMLGYSAIAMIGGGATASLAGAHGTKLHQLIRIVAICGLVVTAVATVVHFTQSGSSQGIYLMGDQLVFDALPYLIIAAILAVVAVAGFSIAPNRSKVMLMIWWVALVGAIFCARLAFYCLQLNVGL